MRWGTLPSLRPVRRTFIGAAPARRTRLALALLSVATYVAVFVAAYPQFGLALAAVATVPVSVIAYLWGTRAGLVSGVIASPIHMALLAIVFSEPPDTVLRGGTGPGSLMLLGVGLIVGRMADMGRQIRRQQEVLIAEREELRDWRARYSELVTTLTAGAEGPEDSTAGPYDDLEASDRERLRGFLLAITPVAGLFGAGEILGGLLLGTSAYAVMGGITLVYGMATLGGAWLLDRGTAMAPLAIGLAVGLLLIGLAGVAMVPVQSPELVLLPILAGAMSLSFLRGRTLRYLLVVCWLTSVGFAVIGEFGAPTVPTIELFDAVVRMMAVPAAAGLIFLLLAAHSSRQRAMLEVLDRRHRDASLAETRYRSLFDGVPIGLYRTTPGGRFLDANPAMVQMLGYASRSELLAASVPAVYVNEADRDAWRVEIERSGLVHAAELEMRRPDGTQLWIRDTAHVVRGPSGEPLYFEGAAEDITEPKRLVGQLRHQAFHDPLTGLANRRLLLDRLQEAIARPRRDGTQAAVLFIDLDDFKLINDSLGHDVGDRVLRALATRLVGTVGPTDTVARLAGDEFTVLVDAADGPDGATELAQLVLASLAAPFAITEREVVVSASIGITMATGHAEEALGEADIAMYAAKASGKARAAMYDPAMHEEAWRRLEIEAQLRGAAERGELVVHYQPIADVGSGAVRSVEALVRWQHPSLGLLPPGAFIDVAEKTGHVTRVGRFVLREACHQVAAWRRQPGMSQLGVSVNMSAVEVRDGFVTDAVREALTAAGLEPDALCMEITESSLLADTAATDRVLHELRALGVRLAIDDFGAGFSSLSYLKRLPVDELKIDRSLVSGIPAGARDETILSAAVAFGKTLGHRVTLEGVETQAQLDAARRVGADAVQGYFISKPLPADEIAPMLTGALVAASSGGR